MSIQSMIKAFLAGLAGAFLFSLLHAPMPWLLGPLFTVMFMRLFTPVQLGWHPVFRNIGLVVAGYVIGFAFTLQALQGMQQYFFVMIIVNCAFFILFLLIAALMTKRTSADKPTALTCCVPGGLSQIVLFAEEQKGINLTAVTFFHVLRVLLIVAVVPFIIAGGGGTSSAGAAESGQYSFILLLLLVVSYGAGFVFQKLRIPTGYLLGPVFFIMVLNLAEIPVPLMPETLLHVAQLLIGIYIGLLLQKKDLRVTKRMVFYAFFSSFVLILAAFGMSVVLQERYGLTFATSFLSTVPGGLDQMGIIAASVNADVTVVTAFQLFRILFVFLIIVPFVKWFTLRERRRELQGAE